MAPIMARYIIRCIRPFKSRTVLGLLTCILLLIAFRKLQYPNSNTMFKTDVNVRHGHMYRPSKQKTEEIATAERITKTSGVTMKLNRKQTRMRDELPSVIVWDSTGGRGTESRKCGKVTCRVTSDRDNWQDRDLLGIVFYGSDFGKHGLPLPRKPGHLWSIVLEESPTDSNWLFSAKSAMSLFNLTATFRRESHYPIPTMQLKDEFGLLHTTHLVPLAEKNRLREEEDGLAPVVFVHWDCNPPSDGTHYMRLLKGFIEIDSYGECDHNHDHPYSMNGMRTSEFHKLIAKYKFIFAFENAVCNDYVTERLWMPLKLGVVPIVFGSPNISDIAPNNHSIIDIRNFRSVQEVANYILFLDQNDNEYRRYLEFKHTGITNPRLREMLDKRDWGHGKAYPSLFHGFECFVCNRLHELRRQILTGQSVKQWKGKDDHYGCPAPKYFDEHGHYYQENTMWSDVFGFSRFHLESLRHHIDNNINATITDIQRYAVGLKETYNSVHAYD